MLNYFNYCNLIDLGLRGRKYTWTNKRRMGAMILEMLDHIVANYEWLNLYPEAHVQHLSGTHSDHCPLLLTLHKNTPSRNNTFRFETI